MTIASCHSPQPTSEITWSTFNIRYDNPYDSLNSWTYRKDTVANFIKAQNLDIVGMQEVLHHQLEDLKARLPEYAEVGVGREDGKTQGEYAPLFYKKDRFELLDNNTFWLSQYPDSVGFIGWDGACTRIATWAKLKDKTNGKIFMAINTHFDHVGTEARKKGALLIIEKIKEIVGDQPAVVTGDFNVSDQSEAYQTITGNSFVLKDAHKTALQQEGASYTFHDFGRIPADSCEKIDFIFVTPQIEVQHSYIPEENREAKKFLSDHNPEIVHLSF
ncbi:endonuclease/exonuclease/phosphatase family protein [Phocaeicola plebeius]|uniref:endonuclease/exonuclease/phosphatase family protein n=1 Tax=Phocaeicola plebeius TaxID=310297 RepID=UPI0015F439CB|nr:endonuclease/exonuclease/phosphatase family protein [Phocaeicola plebeius]